MTSSTSKLVAEVVSRMRSENGGSVIMGFMGGRLRRFLDGFYQNDSSLKRRQLGDLPLPRVGSGG